MERFNILVTAGIIGIMFLILVPLPTPTLDFLFILNISLSLLILVMSMYIRETLEFSMLPSLLLITTLFRLGFNISSTRRALFSNGYAGQVVRTFGQFVAHRNAVIGFVIFLIIVLVQLIVIAKGSEHVAGAAAGFTLDAMPGKQMAIDTDLNSGLIDEQRARERRSKIQKEVGFFDSMDGATKFIEGDAVISTIITFVNLVGDLIVGIMDSQGSIQDIIQIYTTSAIGDDLVFQIPTLLISVATGMVVTRSALENSLSEDLTKQLLAQPRVLTTAGGAAACLCLIPGFSVLQILIIFTGMVGGGYYPYRHQKSLVERTTEELVETEVTSEAFYYKNIENVYGLLNVEQIEMEFGYSLILLADEGNGRDFIDRVVMFRKQVTLDVGFVILSVRIKNSEQLNPNQYSILPKGEEMARGDILMDHYLALPPGTDADDVPGINTVDPAFHIPAKWISEDRKVQTELTGYTLIDPISVVITHLSEVVGGHLHRLLSRQEVSNLLEALKKTNSSIVKDTIPSVISVGGLQKILANLLHEEIPIRDMEAIVETLGDYDNQVEDTNMLTECVRRALKCTVPRQFSEARRMKVISLDNRAKNMIMSSVKKIDIGSYLTLKSTTIQSIVMSVTTKINKIKDLVDVPIVLTSPVVRIYFKKFIGQLYPNVTVVSFNEVGNNIQIQTLGNISLSQRQQGMPMKQTDNGDMVRVLEKYRKNDSQESGNRLIMRYLPTVRSAAVQLWSMAGSPPEQEELIGQGVLALIERLERYDPDRGAKFETFTFMWVRGAMTDYIRNQDWVPHKARNFQKKVEEACSILSHKQIRKPDVDEAADYLDLPVEKVENHIKYMSYADLLSFKSMLQDMTAIVARGELESGDIEGRPEENLFHKELMGTLTSTIDGLGERERLVIILYYYEELKYSEIAQIIGTGQSRVCQIHTRTIQKLKANLEDYMRG